MLKNIIILLFLLSTKILFSQVNIDITPDNFRSSAHITPINIAEAIIEPFWDPTLNGLKEWTVSEGAMHGLKLRQVWAYVAVEWSKKPKDNRLVSMFRDFSLDVSRYDKLIVCVAFPKNSILTVKVKTENGEISYKNVLEESIKKEHYINLNDSKKLLRITLELETQAEGASMGWLNWIGLQNSSLLENYLSQWKNIDTTWDGYLQNENYTPSFKPKYGLIVDSLEIEKLRNLHNEYLKKHGTTPILEKIAQIPNQSPEKLINEYVLRDEKRFNREREYDKLLTARDGYGLSLAVAGILMKDKNLLRLAARYALSIAYCPNWEESFMCNFPGSIWNHRAFTHSMYSFECALILDMAGDYFTWQGREFIMRRIAEEGLATINWISWKYEYVHHMNQLGWFSHGRLAGSVLLEKEWPRASWMTEQGFKDIYESVKNVILPDGGYVEGPTYFQPIAGNAGLAMYIYGKARNKNLNDVIPKEMFNTKDFASAIISSDKDKDVIPICDAIDKLNYDMLLVMANALPNSDWGNILNKKFKREGGLPNSLLALKLFSSFKDTVTKSKSFVLLPDMGLTVSNREYKGEKIKIAFLGNKAFAEHTHEDKGSFILEFAGETFAMDPGTCSYSDPLHIVLKNCERHNMLVPFGFEERVKPLTPIPVNIKPQTTGDDQYFKVFCDLTKSWEGYYKKWNREITSNSPDEIIIKDFYELEKGKGVDFFWNTQLPVEINKNVVIIKGVKGHVVIHTPKDLDIKIDKLPLADGAVQNRIAFRKNSKKGILEFKIDLVLNDKK